MPKRRVRADNSILNAPGHHSTAAICWSVEVFDQGTRYEKVIQSSIQISDCDRKIMLDFDVDKDTDAERQAEFENGVRKVDILISQLQGFRSAYIKTGRKLGFK